MTVARLLIMAMVLGLSTQANGSETDFSTDLARWRGGSLTRTEFVASSDPDETIIQTGGADLTKAVCKASYREIYGDEARAAGLDLDPEFLVQMDSWRTQRLASTFIDRARGPFEPTADEVRAFYHQRLQELYTSSETADLEILFVRCDEHTKDGCGERMVTYQSQIDAGRKFSALIEIEKKRSGKANGVFPNVPLDRLAPELAEAVRTTPDGWLTPVVETSRGLFLIQVRALTPPATIPFDQAERHVRQVMRQERESKWREDEAIRLRTLFANEIDPEADDSEVFAAAARQANLHLEAAFLQAERQHSQWSLADFAFFRDQEMVPSDEEIGRRLSEDPTILKRYERRSLLILVVPATSDRTATLAFSDRVRATFENSSSPTTTAGKLLEENASLISITLDDVTQREIDRVSQSVSDKVSDLSIDQWSGPIAFRKGLQVPADLVAEGSPISVPAGIGFVVVLDVTDPTPEQLRKIFFRQERDAISTPEGFLKAMGKRWEFELLAENGQ